MDLFGGVRFDGDNLPDVPSGLCPTCQGTGCPFRMHECTIHHCPDCKPPADRTEIEGVQDEYDANLERAAQIQRRLDTALDLLADIHEDLLQRSGPGHREADRIVELSATVWNRLCDAVEPWNPCLKSGTPSGRVRREVGWKVSVPNLGNAWVAETILTPIEDDGERMRVCELEEEA